MSGSSDSHLLDRMIATLVLYRKALDESPAFASLTACMERAGSCMDILVYDNSPIPMARPDRLDENISYVHDPSNPGVSKAYNTGFRMARQMGKKWLLLLDQDTEFPPEALERYESTMSHNKTAVLFAPILVSKGKVYSPCGYTSRVGFPLRRIQPGLWSVKGKSLLNSGICIDIEAFERVGGFDESMPLDFADHDFITRYKKHFDSFVLVDVTCRHGFSDNQSTDLDASLGRFRCYCRGAGNSIRSVQDAFSFLALVIVRAVRLSLRHKSFRFFPVILQVFAGK